MRRRARCLCRATAGIAWILCHAGSAVANAAEPAPAQQDPGEGHQTSSAATQSPSEQRKLNPSPGDPEADVAPSTDAAQTEADAGGPVPEEVQLQWIAPEECSKHDQVLGEVLRLIRPVKEPKPVDVTGTVTHEGENWSIQLDFKGSVTGTRSFSSSACESLTAAAAVIIALAINEERPLPEPLPEPVPVKPVPPPPKPVPPKSTPASTQEQQIYLGLGGSIEAALAPVAFGPFVSLGFQHRELRGDLVFGGQPQRSIDSKVPNMSANLSVIWLNARGCREFIDQSLALFGCAAFRLGRLNARGAGTDIEARQNGEWVSSILPGLLLRWPAKTALALELGVESSIPLTRPRVVILRNDGANSTATAIEVYRVAPIGVAARAAISFNLSSF